MSVSNAIRSDDPRIIRPTDASRNEVWSALDEIIALTNRTIDASLNDDTDLAGQSEDFKAGYRKGFTEATIALVRERLLPRSTR